MAAALLLPMISGCSDDIDIKADYPSDNEESWGTYSNNPGSSIREQSLLGGDGIVLLGGPDYNPDAGRSGGGAGIGVNSFLWRASLDTLSFLPLNSADPFGGVIITDWYTPPQTPNERFKVSAFILDRSLRADGVRVSVFRQEQGANGWLDAPVAESMSTDLENAILTRARQLRIRTLASQE
ncbi:MAG: DUF3576 domain-containing protein [Alphaproteobacteria bacterium]|jgi:hypothetical protein|nr:DUF3576 domain-containing protein [Alphaproteobacteria bacterium]